MLFLHDLTHTLRALCSLVLSLIGTAVQSRRTVCLAFALAAISAVVAFTLSHPVTSRAGGGHRIAAGPPIARLTPAVTFSNQVARIMQRNCQVCHHQGGIAPFPLMTYADAYPLAGAIKAAVVSRRMPHAASARLHTGCTNADTFEGIRRLTDEEIAAIVEWVDAGAPEGDPADLPPPLTFDDQSEWKGDDPDFVFANTPEGFNVPPRLNRDFFRRFPLRSNFEVDRYVTSFEALPGVSDLGLQLDPVHHVTLFIDPSCHSLELERAFAASNPRIPGPGFEGEFTQPTELVGMWFPGANPLRLQDGIGIKVPRGACLVMEIHYTTWHEEPIVDRTLVGLKFARAPVYQERAAALVKNENFTIPAGDPRCNVTATRKLDEDVTLYSLTPHMHQFGTDFLVEAKLPNGEKRCLLDVEYDFKHQATYIYKQPLRLPAGTEVKISAFYDNSENNPRQLNHPPIDIPFGRTSDREMCQLTLGLTYDRQRLVPSTPAVSAIRIIDDELVVFGSDLRPGAFIEIDGKLLPDTQLSGDRLYVFSASEWQAACPEGARARISVINPDGGRTLTRTFFRRSDGLPNGRFKRFIEMFFAGSHIIAVLQARL